MLIEFYSSQQQIIIMDNKKQWKEDTSNRIDEIINLTEKKTRSERHLEQHSDIGDPDRLDHVREVQDERDCQIQNLKNNIIEGENANQDEYDNLNKNYEYTQGYIDHNKDHMSKEALKNTQRKQENRKDQMNTFE